MLKSSCFFTYLLIFWDTGLEPSTSHWTVQFNVHSVGEHSPDASPLLYKLSLVSTMIGPGEHQSPSLSPHCLAVGWLLRHRLVSPWHGHPLAIAVRVFNPYPLAVSPWDGYLAIRLFSLGMAPSQSAGCLAVRIFHRCPLAVSPWDGSLAIHSVSLWDGCNCVADVLPFLYRVRIWFVYRTPPNTACSANLCGWTNETTPHHWCTGMGLTGPCRCYLEATCNNLLVP